MNNFEKLNSDFFDKSCETFKDSSWEACCYLDEYMQDVYYHSIFKHLNKNFKTVLDIGCGQADLLQFINRFTKNIDYTGIDVSKNMINSCVDKFPKNNFYNSSLLDFEDSIYDAVFAVGVFNLKVTNKKEDQLNYLKKNINKAYKLCNKSLSMTLLSKNGNDVIENDLFYYEPWEILEYCFNLTSSVVLDHSSIPIEFIITLYKD